MKKNDFIEWSLSFFKHLKQVKSFEKIDKNNFRIDDEKAVLTIIEKLENAKLVEEKQYIIVKGNLENFNFLVEHWDDFLKKDLSIIFVDPEKGLKWHIKPYLHNIIADKKNLRKGLKTSYEAVFKNV